MNLLTVCITLMLFALAVCAQKDCDNDGDCKNGFYCNITVIRKSDVTITIKIGVCVRQCRPGEDCTCEKNNQCKGASTCEEDLDSDPVVKRCTERCRTDNDCLHYINGTNKYCTTGGLGTLEKGYCELKKEEGEDCNRSPECRGKLFCKHGKCVEAAEAVQCQLDCNGPREKNPNNIKPGDNVTVIYNCIFIRRGEFGPLPIKASLRLNKKIKLGSAAGESPVNINGTRVMVARKGEFSAEVQGMMKRCRGHRKLCRASKRCILKA